MNLLITGADQALGVALYDKLAKHHRVSGVGEGADGGGFGGTYQAIDPCDPEAMKGALAGIELVVHTQPYSASQGTGEDAEGALLDQVARSTYVLVGAACDAQVRRIVVLSRLEIMQDYPAQYNVRPDWAPQPRAEAASLAPYMAELVCREIARTGKIEAICLRLGKADTNTVADAVEAAVNDPLKKHGHTWALEHIGERVLHG